MTIQELKDAVSPAYAAFVDQYGPAVLAMAVSESAAFISLLAAGKESEAYKLVASKMKDAEAVADAQAITESWNAANAGNAASIALQKKAATAVLSVVLSLVLASVGL
ncbi:MAG TPA: hypothetical protein PLF81_25515 [Candidatus Anammoximicrobium sp.]|nr:hypothetical protein [Candidatus Anammoximicrobium sp.]